MGIISRNRKYDKILFKAQQRTPVAEDDAPDAPGDTGPAVGSFAPFFHLLFSENFCSHGAG